MFFFFKYVCEIILFFDIILKFFFGVLLLYLIFSWMLLLMFENMKNLIEILCCVLFGV